MSNFNESQQPIRVAHLQVQSDLDEVDRVLQWFEQFYAVLSESLWMQAKLVMVEGLTNAVRHAHENLPRSTPIDLEVRVSSDQLEISIWDEGLPFDFEGLLDSVDRQFSHPLEREAHWGGVLMRKLRQKHHWIIHYHCPDHPSTHRNRLYIQKVFS